MSASLRNSRNRISVLQGRLEGLNLLNMDNVQAMVDRRVENITRVVNKLSSTCTTQCAVQNSPQCKPAFSMISLEAFLFCFLTPQSFSPIIFSLQSYLVLWKPLSIFSAMYSVFSIVLYSILFYLCYFKRCLSSALLLSCIFLYSLWAWSRSLFSILLHSLKFTTDVVMVMKLRHTPKHIQRFWVAARWLLWRGIYPIMPKWTWRLVIATNSQTLGGHLRPVRPVFLGNRKWALSGWQWPSVVCCDMPSPLPLRTTQHYFGEICIITRKGFFHHL